MIVVIGGVGGEGVVVGEGGAWFLRHDRDVVVVESPVGSTVSSHGPPCWFFFFPAVGQIFRVSSSNLANIDYHKHKIIMTGVGRYHSINYR